MVSFMNHKCMKLILSSLYVAWKISKLWKSSLNIRDRTLHNPLMNLSYILFLYSISAFLLWSYVSSLCYSFIYTVFAVKGSTVSINASVTSSSSTDTMQKILSEKYLSCHDMIQIKLVYLILERFVLYHLDTTFISL